MRRGKRTGQLTALFVMLALAAAALAAVSRCGALSARAAELQLPESSAPSRFFVSGSAGGEREPSEPDIIEDAEPPLEIDWAEMYRINPDIMGWLYVDALPQISYPIMQSTDNDFYLHHNERKESAFAGSIFMDYINYPDFADPNTLIYGHNMGNGSMFGSLKYLNNQEVCDRNPYFWILTPYGSYRYKIFSVFNTQIDSDAFLLYTFNGSAFLKWAKLMREQSDVETDVPLTVLDKIAYLSTCTSESTRRLVVMGKCVSAVKPKALYDRITGRPFGDSQPPLPNFAPGNPHDGESLSEIGLHLPAD